MKISIALSVVIVGLALWLCSLEETRIASARESNARLAASLGNPASGEASTSGARLTKRPRENRHNDVAALASGLIAYCSEEKSDRKGRMGDLPEQLASLDRDEFQELFEQLQNRNPVDEAIRRQAFEYAFYRCAMSRPGDALDFLTKYPEALEQGGPSERNAINTAYTFWSWDEPDAALAWFRQNKDKSPDFGTAEAESFLVSGISSKDPRLAFDLLAELSLPPENAELIVRSAGNDRIEDTLAALRGYADKIGDPKLLESGLKAMAVKASGQDFEKASEWIATARLAPAEREVIANNVSGSAVKSEDTGRWIDWLGTTLPAGQADAKIQELVRRWAFEDFQAAADWLSAAPESAAKNLSVRAYAETVSKYRPEIAGQWAATLPPGKDRQETLASVYRNWPKNDDPSKTAAEAFKNRHGIE